jgi:N-6 DNA Methylase
LPEFGREEKAGRIYSDEQKAWLAAIRDHLAVNVETTMDDLGAIFLKAQNGIRDPAKLKRLVGLIDSETWLSLPIDVKGEIYEDLLARNAEDLKSGAGQYFTPRALHLPPPDEVAAEVVESLEAALASFRSVAAKLQGA